VTAVLGPGARGVVVATEDPEVARRDRVWLEDAGVAVATPADLGLRVVKAGAAFTSDPDPRAVPAMHWARVSRRPALASLDGEAVYVQGPEVGRAVERAEALETIEAAMGERPPPRVAVFGGAWTPEQDQDYVSARGFGKALASEGMEIICGGYQGIMAAVCRGAADAAVGATFGVTVAPWATRVMINEWVDHVVEARDLFARLPLLADADAWVAFPGGVGTLKEVALCWNLVQNELATPRPLVVVGERWARLLESFREALIVAEAEDFGIVRHVASPEDAVSMVAEALQ
jgi:uncharacterized protein (TIGR00730 family)